MNPVGAEADITFSNDDVLRFAEWSADRNPLHVDPGFARQTHFGQQVVHGVLTVLRTLAAAEYTGAPVRTLDIEFRSAVFIGPRYHAQASATGSGLGASLKQGEQLVLDIRADVEPSEPPPELDLSWVASAIGLVRRPPVARALADLQKGLVVTGEYPGTTIPGQPHGTALSPTGARVLALCSVRLAHRSSATPATTASRRRWQGGRSASRTRLGSL